MRLERAESDPDFIDSELELLHRPFQGEVGPKGQLQAVEAAGEPLDTGEGLEADATDGAHGVHLPETIELDVLAADAEQPAVAAPSAEAQRLAVGRADWGHDDAERRRFEDEYDEETGVAVVQTFTAGRVMHAVKMATQIAAVIKKALALRSIHRVFAQRDAAPQRRRGNRSDEVNTSAYTLPVKEIYELLRAYVLEEKPAFPRLGLLAKKVGLLREEMDWPSSGSGDMMLDHVLRAKQELTTVLGEWEKEVPSVGLAYWPPQRGRAFLDELLALAKDGQGRLEQEIGPIPAVGEDLAVGRSEREAALWTAVRKDLAPAYPALLQLRTVVAKLEAARLALAQRNVAVDGLEETLAELHAEIGAAAPSSTLKELKELTKGVMGLGVWKGPMETDIFHAIDIRQAAACLVRHGNLQALASSRWAAVLTSCHGCAERDRHDMPLLRA